MKKDSKQEQKYVWVILEFARGSIKRGLISINCKLILIQLLLNHRLWPTFNKYNYWISIEIPFLHEHRAFTMRVQQNIECLFGYYVNN